MLAVVAAVLLAIAAPKGDAEKLIKKGVELRKQRKDAEALAVFKKAHQLYASPRAMAQIALAEQALAFWLDADAHLREALADDADPWIRSNRDPLKKALAQIREHVATVQVRGVPSGASVKIGDQPARAAPFSESVRVVCGVGISIAATAPGYGAITKSITPACGKETLVELAMEREKLAEVVPKKEEPQPKPPPQKQEPAIAPPVNVVQPVPREETTSLSTFGYIAGGGALVGLGTGVAALIVREQHANTYNDDATCLPPNGLTRDQNCRNERRAAESAQRFSIIGFASGAALSAAAIALFALDDSEPETRLVCGPIAGGAGLACAGVFE